MDEARLPPELFERLRAVRSVGAITGAGVSSESGIRTYRGRGGLYDDPVEGDRTVEALSGPTLLRDPDRTWRAVGRLARQALGARPNAAHLALARIERHVARFVLLTQNVDGLHQAAGSRNVIDIHGSIRDASCTTCGAAVTFSDRQLTRIRDAPRCARCRGTLRPGAVLFGELLPPAKVQRVLQEFHDDPPDAVLVIGTSALFPYITAPVEIAARSGRLTVEVNPEPTDLSARVDHALCGAAGVWVPAIARALRAADADEREHRARDALGRPVRPGSPHEARELESPPRDARPEAILDRAAELFDARRFFEAHGFFEHVWKAPETPPGDRPFWRALTQVAVGCCHLQRGNRRGATRVLERAREGLAAFPEGRAGIDGASLRATVDRVVRALLSDTEVRLPTLPRR